MAENDQKFFSDFLYTLVPQATVVVRGIISIPLITKILSESSYGIWTQFNVTLALLAIVSTLNLGFSSNRFLTTADENRLREDYYSLITITLLLSSILVVILYLFRKTFSSLIFSEPSYGKFITLLAGVLFFRLFADQTFEIFRSQRWMKSISILRTGRMMVELLSIGIAIVFFNTVDSLLWGMLISNALIAIFVGIVAVRRINLTIPHFENMGEYLKYGLPLMPGSIGYWMVTVSDRFIVTIVIGLNAVAGYTVFYGIALLVFRLIPPIKTVLFPDLQALKIEEKDHLFDQRMALVLKYYLSIAVPSIVGLIVLAKPLVVLMSTVEIAQFTYLMPFLAVSMLFQGVLTIFELPLNTHDQTTSVGALWGAIGVLNLLLNSIFVPVIGVMGAAIATLGSFIIGTMIAILLYPGSILLSWKMIIRTVVASVVMGFVVWRIGRFWTPVTGIGELAVLVAIGILVYFGLSILLGVFGRSELRFIRNQWIRD